MLIKMAWRNLSRNRRRTILTVLSVAFGVWLAVTFAGMGEHSYFTMLETGARMGSGHLTLQPEGYLDAPGLDRSLEDADGLRDTVATSPEVRGAVVRIMGQAMFQTAAKSVGGAFFAIDPRKETADDNLFLRSLVEGRLFEDPDGRGILVGRKMAEKLGLRLDKRVVFTVVDREGEIVSEVARVSGLIETGVPEVDSSVAVLPIDTVRRVLRYGPHEATQVAIFLDDHRAADRVQTELASKVEGRGIELQTWRQTQPELAGIVAVDRAMNQMFQVLVGLLIAAGVFNTLLMSVLERRKELGMMMAVGTRPSELFRLVVYESLFVGLLGAALGALLSVPWYLFMQAVGIDLTSMMGGDTHVAGVLVDPVLRLLLYPHQMFAITSGVIMLTLIAGLYPAYQAGRQLPAETLKEI